MKLDGLDHPKTLDFAARLSVSLPQAIGHLELLWAFVAQKTPQGNVGKWPDGSIARAAHWTDDPTVFVTALLESGFLDECEAHRLTVHDWAEHCPRWVTSKLSRAGLHICSGDCSAHYSAADTAGSGGDSKPSLAKPSQYPSPAHEDDDLVPVDWQPDERCLTRLRMAGITKPPDPDQVQAFIAHWRGQQRHVGNPNQIVEWFVKWLIGDKVKEAERGTGRATRKLSAVERNEESIRRAAAAGHLRD